MQRNTKLTIIMVLGVIGLAFAGYQTYEHYFLESAVCDLSATFSCSAVTGSAYGEFPPGSGIATAFFGMIWWVAMIYLAYGIKNDKPIVEDQEFALFGTEMFGILFMIYLLVVELYILPMQIGQTVICPFCTVQHVLMLIMLPITYTLLRKPIGESLENIFYVEE